MNISERLAIDFDWYINSPIRVAVNYLGAYGITINLSESIKGAMPKWFADFIDIILSLPYTEALSIIGVLLLVVERYYAVRVRKAELKRLKREAE